MVFRAPVALSVPFHPTNSYALPRPAYSSNGASIQLHSISSTSARRPSVALRRKLKPPVHSSLAPAQRFRGPPKNSLARAEDRCWGLPGTRGMT